ncbi:MAG: hypothetical protein M3N21_00030 [Actinomycetota bacterium]|nr:hypothetical protein [Actinomycetota bacterium]
MRVAYLAAWRGGVASGPFKKIAAQLTAWQAQGLDVGLFATTSPSALADWKSLEFPGLVVAPAGGVAVKWRERRQLVNALLQWAPDLVYERHGLWTPSLTRMSRGVPTVLEVNGDDVREFALHSRPKSLYNSLTRNANFRRAVGLVHVTQELANLPTYQKFDLPYLVVGNGIDLSQVPHLAPTTSAVPRLVWLGDATSPFNSLEHIVQLAELRPGWEFDVVGPRPAAGYEKVPNMTWHTAGGPDVYRPILASADVGIGTLDAYRTGMQQASALKVREYLASGLATLVGYEDTDFPEEVPHLLRIPNRPDSIPSSLLRIDTFVDQWHGRRVARAAVAHLDVAVKEKIRVGFLSERVGRFPES